MADLAIVIGVALVGGLIAYRLKLPLPLGYIVSGLFIGPYSFSLVNNTDMVETMASIGVVLLLFTLGMEYPLDVLKKVGRVGLAGGVIQIFSITFLGFVAGRFLFNWDLSDSVFFAFLIALSSTAVVFKILVERGETNTAHGRIMIAILLVQDLAVLPLMIVLPSLGNESSDLLYTLGLTLGKAALFLCAIAIIGFWVVPRFLGEMAGTRSRELFLITVLAICLGAAYGTSYFGISAAFGAFAAGMLVSRSHFAHQALADIVPFRNAFVALFFVSLGMLGRPGFIIDNWDMVILVTFVIVVVKFIVYSIVIRAFGYTLQTSLFVGLGLIQVGEFSFVIGQAGLERAVISEYLYSLVLSSAIITILFTPLAFKLGETAYRRLSSSGRQVSFSRLRRDKGLIDVKETLSNHVVICGHGRTGSNLSSILRRHDIPYIVVELNPQIIAEMRAQNIPCIYGDSGNHQILAIAHINKARVLALTCPDPMAEISAINYAKEVNPKIEIIARLPEQADTKWFRRAGKSKIVDPFFAVSIEFIRYTLSHYDIDNR